MIEYKTGDLLAQDAEALVNTVNCVGFMGRGIALRFKKAFTGQLQGVRGRLSGGAKSGLAGCSFSRR